MSDGYISCKIGTVPMVIFDRDKRTPLEVGRTIRIKEQRGAHWTSVRVTGVWEHGYFTADRI